MSDLHRSARRAALLELGAVVAREMKTGRGGVGTRMVGDVLATAPQAMLDVMALLEKEVRKKRPDAYLVAALAYVAGQALELIRYGIERADPAAEATLGAARQHMVALVHSDRANPTMLMLLAKQFAAAKLDIGDTLRDAMGRMMVEEAALGDDAEDDNLDMERHLGDLASDLGGDPFAIHTELADTAASFPIEHRIGMAGVMLGSESEAIRHAALGWLFDGDAETRAAIAALLNEQARAGRIDGAMLRRLIASRNWLPPAERAHVDESVRRARRQGIEPASVTPGKVVEILASAFDGSGAGTVFVLVKHGRRHAVASLLFKFGVGLRDAWVRRDLAKAGALAFRDRVVSDLDTAEVPLEHVTRALRHFIGLQVAAGTLPPFGALGVMEALGLGPVNPSVLLPADIVAEVLAAGPSRATPDTALAASAEWLNRYGFMENWFEDDAAVDAALKGRKGLSRARKVELVLDTVVAPRRRRWAEVLAWTALAIAASDRERDDPIAFALVAGELLGDRRADEIPLLRAIAVATVEAHRLRRAG